MCEGFGFPVRNPYRYGTSLVRSVRSLAIFDKHFIRTRKDSISLLFRGVGHFSIASVLRGFMEIPLGRKMNPKQSTSWAPKVNFEAQSEQFLHSENFYNSSDVLQMLLSRVAVDNHVIQIDDDKSVCLFFASFIHRGHECGLGSGKTKV